MPKNAHVFAHPARWCVAVALTGATLFTGTASRPAAAQRPSRAEIVARIDSIINAPIAAGRLVGASVAVVRGADTIVHKGYGKANLELAVPTPPNAIYEIGSVTKQFTGAAVMQLVASGKLSLDDDVTKFVPQFNTRGRRVTIRRLLDHTSGIKGYTEMQEFLTLSPFSLPRDTLIRLVEKYPYDFEPGVEQTYNNSAFFLLGMVIEKVSGESYGDYVQRHLFAPAGMTASHYCSDVDVRPNKTTGYDWGGAKGPIQKRPLSHMWPYAAGSLCSTARDLVAWNDALHRSSRILTPAAYQAMITPDTLNDGYRVGYSKGLVVRPVVGRPALHHGGGIFGWTSDNIYFPAESLSIVVLFNTAGPASPDAAAEAIAEAIFGPWKPTPVPIAGDGQRYAGAYAGNGRGGPQQLVIAVENGTLAATVRGSKRSLVHVGNGVFQAGDTRFVFREDGGKVTSLRVDGGAANNLLRRQP